MRLLLVTAGILFAVGCDDPRYRHLRGVIDRNVGFAHATRGVNADTIRALRADVSAADVGLLVTMLDDRDRVVRIAAAAVLARITPDGVAALERELRTAEQRSPADFERIDLLREALRARTP